MERISQPGKTGLPTVCRLSSYLNVIFVPRMADTPGAGFNNRESEGVMGMQNRGMTQIQVVIRERFPRLSRNIFWQPYSEVVYNGL
jgi:hypothetical protein